MFSQDSVQRYVCVKLSNVLCECDVCGAVISFYFHY